MRVLVTGGAGFIGSHLVRRLIEQGDDVLVMDNFSTGKKENLPPDVPVVEPLLPANDEEALFRAVAGRHVVYHLAALPSVPRSVETPFPSHLNGTDLTFQALDYARQAGVWRFVYASSSSVYGGYNKAAKENRPIAPKSPYAATKAAGEAYCKAFAACYPLDTVSLRFFNVYGPRQDPSSQYSGVIARFCEAFAKGGDVTIHGNGKQRRDFTYVDDVCDALLAAGTHSFPLEGMTFNVGAGENVSILQLLKTFEKITGEKKEPAFAPKRGGDVPCTLACTERLKGILGVTPKTPLKEGLAKTLDWYGWKAKQEA